MSTEDAKKNLKSERGSHFLKRRRYYFMALMCVVLGTALAWQILRAKPSNLPVLPLGADFVLTAGSGEDFALNSVRGRIVLLSFGYTHCPDICPLTLARYRAVLNALGKQARELQPILITVDPTRDTPAKLQAYVRYFDPRIIGLTGTSAQLSVVERQYGAVASISGSGDKSEVSHSDYVYLLDDLGRVRRLYDQQASVADMVAEVRALMSESRLRNTQPPPNVRPIIQALAASIGEVPPSSDVAAMYVTLVNTSDKPVRVLGMSSPVADAVQWHDMFMADGMMTMQQRHDIVLPANSQTVLASGGSHLMLSGLKVPLVMGQRVPVTLRLEGVPALTLTVSVIRREPTGAMSPH